MDSLFREVVLHAGLGRSIEQIGSDRFWKQLILLLHQWLPFDNALATFYPTNSAPQPLEEYDAEFQADGVAMTSYLDGLYLLDPFYQVCSEGLSSGFYRLEEIAPDQFRQSEYFLSYFHDNVLEDEVQFVLRLPTGSLSLSLGMRRLFAAEECGMLGLVTGWVLALMQQHWQQVQCTPQPAHEDQMATQVRGALSRFGAGVLSAREREIAQLILRGYSSKAIAGRLAISPETVKVHRRNLYTKLGLSSQSELFSLFIQAQEHNL